MGLYMVLVAAKIVWNLSWVVITVAALVAWLVKDRTASFLRRWCVVVLIINSALFVLIAGGVFGLAWIGAAVGVAVLARRKGESWLMWLAMGMVFWPGALWLALQLEQHTPSDFDAWEESERLRAENALRPSAYDEADEDEGEGDDVEAWKVCPFCAEDVRAAAVLCRYCGSRLDEPSPAAKPSIGA